MTTVGQKADYVKRAGQTRRSEKTMKDDRCPRCDSPKPHLHPAVQFEGEVHVCSHPFHQRPTPENMPHRHGTGDEPHPIINAAFSMERVGTAMQDAWNEICSDTGCHPDDIERNFEGRRGHIGFTPKHWASAVARYLFAGYVKSTLTVPLGWVVGDGSGTRYRTWGELGPDWTTNRDKALWFARRDDAEAFAQDDEDGWRIIPVQPGGALP